MQGLAENLHLQDQVAQRLKNFRHLNGALTLETVEAKPVFDQDDLRDLQVRPEEPRHRDHRGFHGRRQRRHRPLPGCATISLPSGGSSASPKRWDRIVAIAADRKYALPDTPDSKALQEFLIKEQAEDPLRFPDLSLSVIKLLGSGEYVAEFPGDSPQGHFGLAVKDYAHSTAPNRRYPDLITQRLLKAALQKKPVPYSSNKLEELALHCTEEEDIVTKVERQVGKSAAALLLRSRIGEQFDGVVTGASEKGTWIRIFKLPVEGKLVQGEAGLDVGERLRAKLISVDVDRGFIDFEKVGPTRR